MLPPAGPETPLALTRRTWRKRPSPRRGRGGVVPTMPPRGRRPCSQRRNNRYLPSMILLYQGLGGVQCHCWLVQQCCVPWRFGTAGWASSGTHIGVQPLTHVFLFSRAAAAIARREFGGDKEGAGDANQVLGAGPPPDGLPGLPRPDAHRPPAAVQLGSQGRELSGRHRTGCRDTA